MSKAAKKENLIAGEAALQNLVAWGYAVHPFSDVHFRINRRLDVWPSTRRWYDTRSGGRGQYAELESFVKGLLPLKYE